MTQLDSASTSRPPPWHPRPMDEAKRTAFLARAVDDWGSLTSAALVVIGNKIGLYAALASGGPATPGDLARRTGTVEAYIRPWLINQAAGGYLEYEPATGHFHLPPEHAAVLSTITGGYHLVTAAIKAEPRVAEAFRSGQGMSWGEHDPALFVGAEQFVRPAYEENLAPRWIPALDGVEAKLQSGAAVADVGCGHGAATMIMARAYPSSRFLGFDNHPASIRRAQHAAEQAGISERVTFALAGSDAYPAPLGGFDLIAFFDCLHDMGNPVGSLRHAASTLTEDGTVLVVEPMAGEHIEDNFNPIGRIYAGTSVLICTPHALAEGGAPLGALATDNALHEVATAAGLLRFRRVAETSFNRVFEIRR